MAGANEYMHGPCAEVLAPFVEVLTDPAGAYFDTELQFIVIVHNTMTYRFSAVMITPLGVQERVYWSSHDHF